MNENELIKKEAVRKKLLKTIDNEVKKMLLMSYYDEKDDCSKKAIIDTAKSLGYYDLALNLIGK